jgi:hypothetical protein
MIVYFEFTFFLSSFESTHSSVACDDVFTKCEGDLGIVAHGESCYIYFAVGAFGDCCVC